MTDTVLLKWKRLIVTFGSCMEQTEDMDSRFGNKHRRRKDETRSHRHM